MDEAKIAELRERCRLLQSSEDDPKALETHYFGIVGPLLENEGYTIRAMRAHPNRGLDLVAERRTGSREEVVGAEFKHYSSARRVPVDVLEQALASGRRDALDQLMLVANRPFSRPLLEAVARNAPAKVKLLDLDALTAWIDRVASTLANTARGVLDLTRDFLIRVVRVLARDPAEARKLEWRVVEHLLGEVFSGLGFDVMVTPATGDGGKDIVIRATVGDEKRTYFVELKHWFSNKVGPEPVKEFVLVTAQEQSRGGLFLASSGFTGPTFEVLAELLQPVALGDIGKLKTICQTYVRAESGLWSMPADPFDVLSENASPLPQRSG
ncbi:restriction endonuclease [Sorangium sp. So ce269]